MENAYSKLLDYLKKNNFREFLLIAFEDSDIVKLLQQNFSLNIKVLSKSDFVGSGISSIVRKTREKKYDLVIVSNVNSQVNRTKTSLKVLALLSKSKNHFIIFNDDEYLLASKLKLMFNLFPRLLIGVFYSLFVLIRTYFVFYFYYTLRAKQRKNIEINHKTILFLRTDLAGKIFAGGSVTHTKGFIDGAKQIGFETVYSADFPLINHPISIVVKPSSFLDFFDEFQLMEYHFRMIRRLKSCFKNLQVGLIYQRHSVFNASGVILSSIFKVPLVLEVNYSEVWAKKNWSRLFFEKLAIKMERFAFERADLISVVSEVVKEQIINLGANVNKIIVNPNGVDTEKFSPKIDGSRIRKELNFGNDFIVGFIGTFTRWHGVETLFDAARKVIEKNDRIKFLLIGDGNLKPTLELKTHQLNLNDKIIFTGIIPHDKAPEYLTASDVLVSPHLGFEDGTKFFGSPTKLFEYMAMGKPIIASDLEQIGKIIQNEVNGLKFSPGNVDELVECIFRLYNDRSLGERLGKQAREDVIQNYTWKENAFRVLSKLFKI